MQQAFSTIIIVLFSTFAIFTGRYYEAFAVTHQFSAAVILAMVWIHAGRGGWSTAPSVYLIGAAGFFTITRCLWLFRILYRNLRSGKSLSRAKVERDSKIMFMSVTIPRPWNFKAGQYVKLCMPFLSWGSMLQWHPFALLSYEEINGNMIIRLMIKERKGFTAVLARKGNPDREMLALVDGPYGRDIQLRTYGTVLLFATGIGIAGLLLYAHQTLEEYYAQKTSCRRIFLFWEADDSTANKTLIESDLHRLSSHNVSKGLCGLVHDLI
jgi:predicted ferric reductase